MCLLLTCKKGTKIEFASPMRTVLFLDLREISQSDTIVKQFKKEPTLMSAYIMNPRSGKVSWKGSFLSLNTITIITLTSLKLVKYK